jgi:flagella basal body P-ring formation protein FlgA
MIPKRWNRLSEKIMRKRRNWRSIMRRALAVAFALVTVAPAAAQSGSYVPAFPRLKAEATVSSDIVRIGDLVENAGIQSNTPIFRAPDLGETGAVPVTQVLDAIRPHGFIGIQTAGLREIVVTRASRAIPAADIEARITQALISRYSLGKAESLKLTFDRDVRAIQIDPGTTADLTLERIAYDPNARRFDAVFELGGGRMRWRFAGSAVETIEVAVVSRPLARGEIVKVSDVTIERRPRADFLNEPAAAAGEVVGMAARRNVRANQPLRMADLMKPELVQRGDIVTLHYEVPGIVLSMRGKALESGTLGDTVNVLNEQSKRTIQGVVTAQGHVTVTTSANAGKLATRARTPAAALPDNSNLE